MSSKILSAVKERLPKFNDFLLKTYREKQVGDSLEFISIMCNEVVKLLQNTPIKYIGHRVFTPEERATFEIEEGLLKNSINIRSNEVMLVGFDFAYKDEIFTIRLYIPYLYDGFVVLNNTKYSISFSFTEKLFSRIKKGISIKVIRSPIQFKNDVLYQFISTEGTNYVESILTTDIHHKNKGNKKSDLQQTIIHYLLCQFGFEGTLNIFGLTKKDIDFAETVGTDTDVYEYFSLKKSKNTFYIKATKEIMKEILPRRIVSTIIYILSAFRKHQYSDFAVDNNHLIFRLLLGKIIHGRTIHQTMIYAYMQNHFNSLNSYFDPIIKMRFHLSGIHLNDIYDLLIFVCKNIDKILVEQMNNNLYDRRVDIFQAILVKTVIGIIYNNFYTFSNRTNTNKEKYIKNLFNISPKAMYKLYEMSNVRHCSGVYHDNQLISAGGKVTKMFNNSSSKKGGKSKNANSGSGELSMSYSKFHPSFAVIESLIDFSSNPTATAVINPFAQIDEDGGFIKPKFANKLDDIKKYLSN